MPTAEGTKAGGDGYQRIRPGDGATWIESPGATDKSQRSTEGGANSRAEVHDHGSKALATISLIIACILPSLALGALAVCMAFSPQVIDAKIQAGIAKPAEEAHLASVKAQLTERDLTIVREALQKKGIDLPPKD